MFYRGVHGIQFDCDMVSIFKLRWLLLSGVRLANSNTWWHRISKETLQWWCYFRGWKKNAFVNKNSKIICFTNWHGIQFDCDTVPNHLQITMIVIQWVRWLRWQIRILDIIWLSESAKNKLLVMHAARKHLYVKQISHASSCSSICVTFTINRMTKKNWLLCQTN